MLTVAVQPLGGCVVRAFARKLTTPSTIWAMLPRLWTSMQRPNDCIRKAWRLAGRLATGWERRPPSPIWDTSPGNWASVRKPSNCIEKALPSKENSATAGASPSLINLGEVTCTLGEYQESRKRFDQALKTAMGIRAAPLAVEALIGGKRGREDAVELRSYQIPFSQSRSAALKLSGSNSATVVSR